MRHRAGCRFRLTLAAACAASAAIAVGSASHALAQSDPAPRRNAVVVHDGKTVPANGGVLVLVPTSHPGPDAKAGDARIEVLRDGTAVAGSLRELGWVEDLEALSMSTNVLVGAGLVWTADEELDKGARYDMTVEVATGVAFQASFVAGKAWEPGRPTLEFDAELGSVDTGQREEHCCSTFLDGTGDGGCFVKRYAEVPALTPELAADEAEERLQQFVYMFRAFEPDTNTTLWASGFRSYASTDFPVPFLSSQTSYCVALEAMHILSRETFHWEHCTPAEDLPDGILDPTDAIAEALQLRHCSVPEYGDVLQWCEINHDACAESAEAKCRLYEPLCGGTLPEAFEVLHEMELIREGRYDAGMSDGHAHDTHDAGPGDDEDGEPDTGCRTVRGSASPAGSIASVLVALGVLVRRRRSSVRNARA